MRSSSLWKKTIQHGYCTITVPSGPSFDHDTTAACSGNARMFWAMTESGYAAHASLSDDTHTHTHTHATSRMCIQSEIHTGIKCHEHAKRT